MNRPHMEIEFPRRLAYTLLFLLTAIGPTLLGYVVSPTTETGTPLLLSPRLASVSEYHRAVRGWVEVFKSADDELTALLQDQPKDLFAQNNRVNQVYGRMLRVVAEIDQTAVPPTFEKLHDLVTETALAYLEASAQVAQWISEPTEDNLLSAIEAVEEANQLLKRVYANPWTSV